MDIVEELFKWKQTHTQKEWELANDETLHFMDELNEDLGEVEYFIKYQECNYNRTMAVINRK